MSSTSRPNPSAGMAPPLPRAWLDTLAAPIRTLFGIIFIAWSWISTVNIVGAWLRPLLTGAALAMPDWFLVAFLFACLVSLVEFVSSDRWPWVYWLVMLFLDASFTSWQTHTWLVIIVQAQTEIASAGHSVIWLVSIVGGIVAAKFGEVLLFGRK